MIKQSDRCPGSYLRWKVSSGDILLMKVHCPVCKVSIAFTIPDRVYNKNVGQLIAHKERNKTK